MPTPTWTRIVIASAAIAWAAIIVATGGSLDPTWARALGGASTVVVLLLLAYDRWIWHWPLVSRLTNRPDVRATWKVEMRTTWAQRAQEVIEAYLVIRQTYSTLSVDILTAHSRSQSMSAALTLENRRCVLYYVFRMEAGALHREGNPPRRGGAALTVARHPAVHLDGDYWTEGDTRGHIRSVGRSRTAYDTFADAQAGDYR